ncbi:uncharacterized protein F4812DRAFT_296389 [Daldinia caldariorum]|uniref:uncharacterized protein n=1 Tax=Daldinia caldariorum TaxID=326644 RepID=UPI002008C9CE|nr:uncharacterized protein F4812DRAFT_296389 [Daldinia caldariorum]KAI1469625.1 hypothetical protein F4812DRAFT_296389 [Daldinia caldariorum]
MPTFVTHEMYTCSHTVETVHRTFGLDDGFRLERLQIPSMCALCFCRALLRSSYELEFHDDDARDRRRILTNLMLPYKRQLAKHLHLLVENKRCAKTAIGIRGWISASKQIRVLEKLSRITLTATCLGEFQAALRSLIAIQESEPRYPSYVRMVGNVIAIGKGPVVV